MLALSSCHDGTWCFSLLSAIDTLSRILLALTPLFIFLRWCFSSSFIDFWFHFFDYFHYFIDYYCFDIYCHYFIIDIYINISPLLSFHYWWLMPPLSLMLIAFRLHISQILPLFLHTPLCFIIAALLLRMPFSCLYADIFWFIIDFLLDIIFWFSFLYFSFITLFSPLFSPFSLWWYFRWCWFRCFFIRFTLIDWLRLSSSDAPLDFSRFFAFFIISLIFWYFAATYDYFHFWFHFFRFFFAFSSFARCFCFTRHVFCYFSIIDISPFAIDMFRSLIFSFDILITRFHIMRHWCYDIYYAPLRYYAIVFWWFSPLSCLILIISPAYSSSYSYFLIFSFAATLFSPSIFIIATDDLFHISFSLIIFISPIFHCHCSAGHARWVFSSLLRHYLRWLFSSLLRFHFIISFSLISLSLFRWFRWLLSPLLIIFIFRWLCCVYWCHID